MELGNINFDRIKFPCDGEFLYDKEKGIWEKCLVHGFFSRGSSANAGMSLEGFWGITQTTGINKEIYGWQNVRFTILRDPS